METTDRDQEATSRKRRGLGKRVIQTSTQNPRKKNIRSRIREFLAPPIFPDDEEKTRQARVLNTLLVDVILFLVFIGCIGIPLIFAEKLFNSITLLILLVIMGVAYGLMRNGRVQLSSALFTFGFWAVFTLFLFFAGGTRSVVIAFYVAGTVIAGLLLGPRGALVQVAVCCLAGLGMAILEISGHPLPRIFPITPIVGWVDMVIALLITMAVVNLVIRSLHDSLSLTQKRLVERRQAEAALRESEEKFRRLFETSRDFLYITDLEGRIIETNKAASTMSGYSLKELRKINIQELYFDAKERDILVEKILERGFADNYEIRGRKKDGTIVAVLVNSTVIKDDDGIVVGFQGSIKDITERKQAEEELKERMDELVAWQKATLGREGRVMELKNEINELLAELGRPPRYEKQSKK